MKHIDKFIGQEVTYQHPTTGEAVTSTVVAVLEYRNCRNFAEWHLRLDDGAVIQPRRFRMGEDLVLPEKRKDR